MCAQLREMARRLPSALLKQGKIILIMDNERPHLAKKTKSTLEKLGIEWLPHPPYSPDLSPCDYHYFRSLQDHCKGREFTKISDAEDAFKEWMEGQPTTLWSDGLAQLPIRWKTVVDTHGQYYD